MANNQPPVLFEMDEFPTLGKFPLITDALARFRGYGVKFHLYVQTLAQLKEVYGEAWQTIMGNCGCIQYFGGTNDLFTAETISKLCGVTTRVQRSVNSNSSPGNQGGESYGTYKRPLLTPDEVMHIKKPTQLILCSGENLCPATLFSPDLRDFAPYLAFMSFINAGLSPEKARAAAFNVMKSAAANKVKTQNSPVAKPGIISRIFGGLR